MDDMREKVKRWLRGLMEKDGWPVHVKGEARWPPEYHELLTLLGDGEPVAWREKFFHADCTLHTVLGIIEEDGAHLGPVIQKEVDAYLAQEYPSSQEEAAWICEELDMTGYWRRTATLNYQEDDPDTRNPVKLYLHVPPHREPGGRCLKVYDTGKREWDSGDIHHEMAECALSKGHDGPCDPPTLQERDSEVLADLFKHVEKQGVPNDWACIECVPNSNILVDGFRCTYHKVKAILQERDDE